MSGIHPLIRASAGVCRRAVAGHQLLQHGVATTTAVCAAPVASAVAATFRPAAALIARRAYSLLTAAAPQPHVAARPLLAAVLGSGLPLAAQPVRTVTKFSLRKGKRKTVKAVVKRFLRLDWGGWIRTRQGRNKKMWRKTGNLKRRLRQHVLVNAQQSWLLDKMVTPFWRRPRHYVDDPYRPYHSREEFVTTRRQPIKY